MSDQIKAELNRLQNNLESHIDKQIDSKLDSFKTAMEKNQQAIDNLFSTGDRPIGNGKKSFGDAFAEEIKNQFSQKSAELKAFQNDRDSKISFTLKSVGTMTVGNNLTGDGMAAYSQRNGIVPNQRINFRDLIPAVDSPTGIYVGYRETGGEGSISEQTEGQSKSQIDYDFTEVKTVSGYVAGFARFSKQMMYQLPWLQNTLTRMLLRDFYKKENAKFYASVVSGATGFNTSSETDDAMHIIDILMGRADQDFNNSFVLVRNSDKGRLLKLLYQNGFYMGAGSVVGTASGSVSIADTPIIGVSWATSDKVMVIDSDFIERVQTENLRVEFSYEDSDNFQKNLITARVECFEDLNLLRTDAHSVADLGNS